MPARPRVTPPVREWPSELDWSGRPFPHPDPAPDTAETEPSDDTAPSDDPAPSYDTAPEPSSDAGTTDATPGPAVDDQPESPGYDPAPDPAADTARESDHESDHEGDAGAEAAVLAEDVFAGLFDGPEQPARTETIEEHHQLEHAAEFGPAELDPAEVTDDLPAVEELGEPGRALPVVGDRAWPAAAAGLDGRAAAAVVASRVREVAPRLVARDTAAAIAAGALDYVRALADPRPEVREHAAGWAVDAAARAASRAAAVLACGPRATGSGQLSWQRAGMVIPVLGAGSGVGASVAAAALFDTLDAAGVPTLLIDAADPARSGLARATSHQGSATDRRPHPEVGIAYAPRGGGWVASLSTPPADAINEAVVPDPSWWLPLRAAPVVTVVDLGWDPWEIAATPLRGAGAWLQAGDPPPRPLLVTTATTPGLAKAHELTNRLRPWTQRGQIAAPAGLVLTGARRWPPELRAAAARELGALTENAVLLPRHRGVAVGGVGPQALPARLRAPMVTLLARWGLPLTAAPRLGRFLEGR